MARASCGLAGQPYCLSLPFFRLGSSVERATAQAPPTRTRPNIAAKDAARRAAEATCRRYAQMLKTNLALTDQQRAALGLTITGAVHRPLPPPQTSPLLTIIAATHLAHTLRYADAATPARRAKPRGVMQLQLHRTIGPAPAVDPQQAAFYGAFTRQPLEVSFSAADQGRWRRTSRAGRRARDWSGRGRCRCT